MNFMYKRNYFLYVAKYIFTEILYLCLKCTLFFKRWKTENFHIEEMFLLFIKIDQFKLIFLKIFFHTSWKIENIKKELKINILGWNLWLYLYWQNYDYICEYMSISMMKMFLIGSVSYFIIVWTLDSHSHIERDETKKVNNF